MEGIFLGKTHDELASFIGSVLLENIRTEKSEWKQIFSNDVCRVGDWDWPRPDYVLADNSKLVTYANEFKPPKQSKREYLTGLGQAIAYLQKHDYSGLILPKYADDGFEICEYICNILKTDEFKHLPISVIEYDEDNINSDSIKLLKGIEIERGSIPINKKENSVTKTFWCFWRDASHYEVYELLKLADKYNDELGDIYTKFVYEEFYEMLVTKRTKMWDGTARTKNFSVASKKSEKQNYKISLFHLGLWSQSEGRLTVKGYKLLTIGKIYGANSKKFIDYLTYLILIDGRHLQLIHEFEEFQRIEDISELKRSEYFIKLDYYLENKGFIGKRKPTARTTNAKGSYIRDETKLWNHLGLIYSNNTRYFLEGEGLRFNWNRISELLINNYEI